MESGADRREMGKFIQPQLLSLLFTAFHSILQFILMFSDTKFLATFFCILQVSMARSCKNDIVSIIIYHFDKL